MIVCCLVQWFYALVLLLHSARFYYLCTKADSYRLKSHKCPIVIIKIVHLFFALISG